MGKTRALGQDERHGQVWSWDRLRVAGAGQLLESNQVDRRAF